MSNQGLSNDNREVLLKGLHALIRRVAADTISNVRDQKYKNLLFYPAGSQLENEECSALDTIIKNPSAESAFEKLLINNSAAVIFEILNWIDGTGDPEGADWTGVNLIDLNTDEDREMLHDAFLHSVNQKSN